jgi:cell wall-associated NlpC family hydrolase
MSYEAALQRVGELRALTGGTSTGSTSSAAAAIPGAFDAQLAQQQALLQQLGTDGAGYQPETANSLSQYGVPVLSLQDQYRMLGMPLTQANQVGFPSLGSGAVGQRMVQLAQGEIGVSETGGNNEGGRIREYRSATAGAENTPGPWCAYFVSWLAKNAGAPIGPAGNGTGYVPTLEAWGKQEGRYQDAGTARPQPGDIVIFDWAGDGVADHTGIVERVDADGSVHTIEGNASDQVLRRTYGNGSNDIKGFVRPG